MQQALFVLFFAHFENEQHLLVAQYENIIFSISAFEENTKKCVSTWNGV